MTALLLSELQRLLARRLVQRLLLLVVLAVVVTGAIVFVRTEPSGFRPPFRLTVLHGVLQGTTAPLAIAAWLVGASAFGAEWQSRSLATVLTWEPRRVRLLLAKALACMVVAAAFTLVAQALVAASLLPAAWWHGTPSGTGGRWLGSVLGVVGRGMLLSAVTATIGFSFATMGRSTAAALGIGFAYMVVVENLVSGLLPGWRPWLFLGNAVALVSGSDTVADMLGHSVLVAGLTLAGTAATLLAVAVGAFWRRDVA